MKTHWRVLALTLSVSMTVMSATLLITGHPWLTQALLHEPLIPVGTLTTALGLIGLAAIAVLVLPVRARHWARLDAGLARVSSIVFGAALAWVPISFLLAGNLSFSFSPGEGFRGSELAMRLFWTYTRALVALPLLLIPMRLCLRLPIGRRRFEKIDR